VNYHADFYLLGEILMAGPQAVSLTGDDYIDALLTGYKR
jgi:hypothetical protein